VETGQGPSTLISPCIYLGGSSDLSGFDSNTNATVEAEGLFKNMSIDTSEIQLLLGKAVYPSLARDVYGFRESSSPFIHSLSFDRIEQAFQLIWANSTANAIAYEITGYLNEDGRNLLRFPDGIWIGRGTSRRRFVIRSAMPSDTDPTSPVSRLWRQGDRIYHDDPVPAFTHFFGSCWWLLPGPKRPVKPIASAGPSRSPLLLKVCALIPDWFLRSY